MSDLVGPTGKVFAEDIADDAIDSIRERVRTFGLQNVEIVKGHVDNPDLPADALDSVLSQLLPPLHASRSANRC
jgi:precorrin-6B methylase 2